MAMAVGQTLTTNLWAAIVFRDGTPYSPLWQGLPAAFPGYVITNNASDGADFSGDNIPYPSGTPPGLQTARRTPLYLTVQGNACVIKVNTGQDKFVLTPPGGYFPGWPDFSGFPNPLDASSIVGDVSLETPYIANFTGGGLIQTGVARSIGNFYVEYTIVGTDVFSTSYGVGIGRQRPVLDSWLANNGFSGTDTNGGAGVVASVDGNFVGANGTPLYNIGGGAAAPGSDLNMTIGVAISIFPPPAVFVPYDVHPIALKCFPCDGILATRKAAARMG
jgi:hypothetical protein